MYWTNTLKYGTWDGIQENGNNTSDVSTFYDESEIEEIQRHIAYSKKIIEYMNSYKARRRRALVYTSRKTVRKFIFNRDGEKCKYCGTTKNLTLDHIFPVSKGGEDTFENLQVLCRSCNSKKKDEVKKWDEELG